MSGLKTFLSRQAPGIYGRTQMFWPWFLQVMLMPARLYWRFYFFLVDGLIGRYLLPITEHRLRRYTRHLHWHPQMAFILGAKQFSMLHEDLLALIHHLAATSRGGILEIGTYVGGSTVTMAQAVALHGRPAIVSIEPGGRASHDLIPSEDIFGDLERNLARFRLGSHVCLLRGFSSDPQIQAAVRSVFAPGSVTLLVIDADGNVERDIGLYADLLRDGAVLVLDDYASSGAPEKALLIKAWVDDAVARGQLTSLGVWGWGTWVGVWRCRS